jgi:hypothetical protein
MTKYFGSTTLLYIGRIKEQLCQIIKFEHNDKYVTFPPGHSFSEHSVTSLIRDNSGCSSWRRRGAEDGRTGDGAAGGVAEAGDRAEDAAAPTGELKPVVEQKMQRWWHAGDRKTEADGDSERQGDNGD